jgi:alpha-galactosidase
VLAVNQDALGIPARRVQTNGCEVWKKPLSDGSVAVALINRGATGTDVQLKASDIGLLDANKLVRNLWSGEDIGEFERDMTHRVQPHQTLLFKVSPP